MNKIGIAVGILVFVAALVGAFFVVRHIPTDTQQETQPGSGNAAVGANGTSAVIAYTDEGFFPSELSIAPGTTVTWSNESSHALWVAPAGAADVCTASAAVFNQCQTVGPGGTYSLTFTVLGTVPYVNHAQSTDRGTLIVSADVAGPLYLNAIPQ